MAHRAKSALGGDKKYSAKKKSSGDGKKSSGAKKRKVHRMHISPLHSGHFLAEHEYAPEEGMSPEPERHAVDAASLAGHVSEHMGAGGAEEMEPEPGVNPSSIPNQRMM